jgi:hypothetical protein
VTCLSQSSSTSQIMSSMSAWRRASKCGQPRGGASALQAGEAAHPLALVAQLLEHLLHLVRVDAAVPAAAGVRWVGGARSALWRIAARARALWCPGCRTRGAGPPPRFCERSAPVAGRRAVRPGVSAHCVDREHEGLSARAQPVPLALLLRPRPGRRQPRPTAQRGRWVQRARLARTRAAACASIAQSRTVHAQPLARRAAPQQPPAACAGSTSTRDDSAGVIYVARRPVQSSECFRLFAQPCVQRACARANIIYTSTRAHARVTAPRCSAPRR